MKVRFTFEPSWKFSRNRRETAMVHPERVAESGRKESSGTPSGCGLTFADDRGYRSAQPPANFFHPSGMRSSFYRQRCRYESGLTLVEILVASTLLLFITLGLTAMFSQTQRAFRGGLKQKEVLGGGQAALEIIARDFQHMVATHSIDDTNLFIGPSGVGRSVNDAPVVGTEPLRTNYLQEVFLMTQVYSTNWQGIGYRVLNPNNPVVGNFAGVGTLYRFFTNTYSFSNNNVFDAYFWTPIDKLLDVPYYTNVTMWKILDGVVHFHVRAYDVNGRAIMYPTNYVENQIEIGPLIVDQERIVAYRGSALPAMIEIELGVLEPVAYEQMKPILALASNDNNTNTAAVINAQKYIAKNGGRIRIFRQQIPIRPARQ